ncbi:MAG: class I SAM-dependent methyltransferase [Acidobacteria bacterium]|nr:class I SAM-dependent methyltransferase [Acidobacteriota bacterium]
MVIDLGRLYRGRFREAERESRAELWRVLCTDFFQNYIRPTDRVLDVGAGYCEFINNIHCGEKIVVDLNEDTARWAATGVRVIQSASTDLSALHEGSIDVAFVSNFFEHLPSKADFLATLAEIRRVLVPGGKLLILQPNIRFLHGEYWDFIDHHLPLTDRSLVEALEFVGLQPMEVRPRFLPYTTKGRLPRAAWLVRLYLRVPLAHRLLGKQAWVVAIKPETLVEL